MANRNRFDCNICGIRNELRSGDEREESSCCACGATLRYRSVALALSRAVFGLDLSLNEFPCLKGVCGLGISDSEIYARVLDHRFDYTNTFFHREPRFDLARPDERRFGQCDFVICSDVLEHVAAPIDAAFTTLARLLRPGGSLILTAPYAIGEPTREHFPEFCASGLADVGGRTVLVRRAGDGTYAVSDQLIFHRGQGATLEMRLFSEADLRSRLAAAGLANVRVMADGNREFGVVFSSPCSLPIVATRGQPSLRATAVTELTEQFVAARRLLHNVRESKWLRIGRAFGMGPKLKGDVD